MGEIQSLDLGTGATRFDPNVDGHHHLVCSTCGTVRDLYVTPEVPLVAGQIDGFTVDATELILRGHCDGCSPPDHTPPHHHIHHDDSPTTTGDTHA